MTRIPLSEKNKKTLRRLEPSLRACVRTANFSRAKQITSELQAMLRPLGQETRLLQAKNWLYETAIEAGEYSFAERGFIGTRKLMARSTRTYLEASALLAVCYLRQDKLNNALPLIQEALGRINNIKSDKRRRQFHRRLLARLEEESILAGLHVDGPVSIEIDEPNRLALEFVAKNKSEEDLLVELGSALPKKSIHLVEEVRGVFEQRLPGPDRLALPPPLTEETKEEFGQRSRGAIKRVIWKALCDENSDLYKSWTMGASAFYDKKVLMGAIAAACVTASIAPPVIFLAAIAALALKFGAALFCEMYVPEGLMIDRIDRK